jgi:hypothetical protein
MHRLPVQSSVGLRPDERELLELCADDWTPALVARVLGVSGAELRLRVRGLCARLGMALPEDGDLPVDGARLVLVGEARLLGDAAEAA